MANEEWRPVVGFETQYEVSTLGRVRTIATGLVRKTHCKRGTNYQLVTLLLDSKHNTRSLHRLVLEAFVGKRPPGHQCAHLDGDPRNNCLANLAWVTARENSAHKVQHGTVRLGERHHAAVFTDDLVSHLRERIASGESTVKLAEELGVWRSAVRDAVVGRTWGHIPGALKSIPRTTLSSDDVRHIRRSHLRITSTELARRYGVTRSCIKNIWYRKSFANLAD